MKIKQIIQINLDGLAVNVNPCDFNTETGELEFKDYLHNLAYQARLPEWSQWLSLDAMQEQMQIGIHQIEDLPRLAKMIQDFVDGEPHA